MAAPGRRAWIALGFALAALLACWSPLAAPFGLFTGLGAAVLAIRARRDGARAAAAALALGLLASGTAGWVLVRTVGLGRPGGLASPGPVPAEPATGRRLDEAAELSRAARERAAREAEPATTPRPRN